MYNRNQARDANRDVTRRRASINELSDEEIVLAYQRVQATRKSSCDSSEIRDEFQRWLEMKKSTSSDEQPKSAEKVNTIDDVAIPVDVLDVVKGDETKHSEDFDDFRDVISDNEEGGDEEYLKVPLVILEDEQAIPSAVIESNIPTEKIESLDEPNVVEAKITLGNAALEVVTSLSSSNFSLASDQSCDDTSSIKKRPANHSKGRAPQPPSSSNVMPGFYFDHVTQKLFKETEL
jgi:hypothetical protein